VDASLITADRASIISPKALERKSEKMDAENASACTRILIGLFFKQAARKGGQDAGGESPEVSLPVHRLGVTPFTFKGLTISRVNRSN